MGIGNFFKDLLKDGKARIDLGPVDIPVTIGTPRPPSLSERVDRVIGMPAGRPERDSRLSGLVTEALSNRDYPTALKAARNESEYVRDSDLSRVCDAALSETQMGVAREAAGLLRFEGARNDRLLRVAEKFEQLGDLSSAKDTLRQIVGYSRPIAADALQGRLVERFLSTGDLSSAVEMARGEWTNGWQRDELMNRAAHQAIASGRWGVGQEAVNLISDYGMRRKAQRDLDYARMPPPPPMLPPAPPPPHHPHKPGVSIDLGPVTIDIR